jgi:hypothetical protein
MSIPFLQQGRPTAVCNEDGTPIAGGSGGASGYEDATTPAPALAGLVAFLDAGVVHIVTPSDPLPVMDMGGGRIARLRRHRQMGD